MPSRRQFLTTSALSLAGILSIRETKANGFKTIQEGVCISPIFHTQGRYKIGRNQQEGHIPKVEILWQDNRNWTNDAYIRTVEREEVLKTVEENRKIFEIAENIASNLGFPNPFNEIMQKIQEGLGIRDPKQFTLDALLTDLSPELSQELSDVQRWDIYKHIAGTIAGNRIVTTTDYISFRPSNIPEIIYMSQPRIEGDKATISWQGHDKTTYPELNLPWYKFRFPQLPLNNIDLTIFLNEPYDSTVRGYNVQLLEGNQALRFTLGFTNQEETFLALKPTNIGYRIGIQAIDDADNESRPVYSATFTPESYQPTQQPQTTNDKQSIEEIIRERYTLEAANDNGFISQEEANIGMNFYNQHITQDYARKIGVTIPITNTEQIKELMFNEKEREIYRHGIRFQTILPSDSFNIQINRNQAIAQFDLGIIATIPPALRSQTEPETENIHTTLHLIKLGDTWKIDSIEYKATGI